MSGIRSLDRVLFEMESRPGGPATHRDPDRYAVAVFGEPGDGPWGWRLQGHHLSLNLTAGERGGVAHAPLFLGANPRRVEDGEQAGLEQSPRFVIEWPPRGEPGHVHCVWRGPADDFGDALPSGAGGGGR